MRFDLKRFNMLFNIIGFFLPSGDRGADPRK